VGMLKIHIFKESFVIMTDIYEKCYNKGITKQPKCYTISCSMRFVLVFCTKNWGIYVCLN